MDREVAFKKGSDQASVTADVVESLACESCSVRVDPRAARDDGWQVTPPVCPECLRWNVVDDGTPERIRIERRGRHWAVYENGELLCITVYRKGARAVASRLRQREAQHGRR